jgi:hypothetical protein
MKKLLSLLLSAMVVFSPSLVAGPTRYGPVTLDESVSEYAFKGLTAAAVGVKDLALLTLGIAVEIGSFGYYIADRAVTESGIQNKLGAAASTLQSGAASAASTVGSTLKNGVATVGAVALLAGGGVAAGKALFKLALYNRRHDIKDLRIALSPQNPMMTHNKKATTKIFNWNTNQYPTARTLRAAGYDVLESLLSDVVVNSVNGLNEQNYDQITPEAMRAGIRQAVYNEMHAERIQLQAVLNTLEQQYLRFEGFAIKPRLGLRGNSIVVNYSDDYAYICAELGASVNNPALWSEKQEKAIDEYMLEQTKSTKAFVFCSFNYAQAARLYWITYKKLARLDTIKALMVGKYQHLKDPALLRPGARPPFNIMIMHRN